LQTLPIEQRLAVVLHHLADLPVEEVAEIECRPAGTIKARLFRGRAALAAVLAEPSGHLATTPVNPDPEHEDTGHA